MIRIVSFIAGLLLALPAWAQQVPDPVSKTVYDIYSPIDYGARCDSTGTTGTDDAAAINRMFNAIRAANKPFTVVSPENQTCFVAASINATGLNTFTGKNLGIGSEIKLRLDCATNGTPCIDALDSRWVNWEYLYLNGVAAAPPNYGIQIGVIQPFRSADMHYFNRPVVKGHYTVAAVYNLASEAVIFMEPFISNDRVSGTTYGMIADGYNHWNTTSAFQTVAVPVDSAGTFNDNLIVGGWVSGAGPTGIPLWIGGAARFRMISGYTASQSTECVHIFQTGSQSNFFMDMDFHCETTSVADVFKLTGSGESGQLKLYNFVYRDFNPQPSRSVFKTDSSITSVILTDTDIRVGGFDNGGGDNVKLFNEPDKWQIAGHVTLPSVKNWTQPLKMDGGEVCFRDPITCYPVVPTEALNRNPDFVVDQRLAGQSIALTATNTLVTDAWRMTLSGLNCANGTFLTTFRTTDSPPDSYFYSLKLTVGTSLTPTATQQCSLISAIEGGQFSTLRWGLNLPRTPVNLSAMLKAGNAGIYNLALQDSTRTHSYVVSANITIPNFWTKFNWTIPAPDATQWTPSEGPGSTAGYIAIPLATGSNFKTTANAWQAGNFMSTIDAFNFPQTGGSVLSIGYLHLQPAPIELPHKPRSIQQEYAWAQRYYMKTFTQSQLVAQSQGVVGALSTILPYAQSTFGSINIPWRFPQSLYTAAPTLTAYSTGVASSNCYNVTKARDSGAATFTNTSDQSTIVNCALVAGDAIGDVLSVQATADAGN